MGYFKEIGLNTLFFTAITLSAYTITMLVANRFNFEEFLAATVISLIIGMIIGVLRVLINHKK